MTSKRFGNPLNDEQVRVFIDSTRPENTKRQEEWALKLWSDWREHRMDNGSCYEDDQPPDDIRNSIKLNEINVNKWVSKFIMEVRQSDGREYNPASLKCILAALLRYIKKHCDYKGASFFDKESPVFSVLNAKLKDLKSNGVGLFVKRADRVTIDDEIKFWSTKVFDLNTSQGLLYATFFYNGKILALRGRSEHYNLQIEQFNLIKDGDGADYVEFWPTVRKNNQGTMQYSKVRTEAIKQFDTENPNSYYKIIKKYISCLPVSTGKFYRKALPGKEPRFGVAVIGINTIGSMLKTIFNAAGIDDSRNISNHGLRATSASVMLEAGFSQRTVAIRTGHHSNALESYIRDSKATHLAVSAALEPINVDQNISSSSQLNLIEKKDIAIENESKTEEVETEEEDEDEDEEEDTAEKRIKAPKRKKDDDPIVIELRKGSKILKISM